MDFSRLHQGEIIAGLAGIALIIFMFLPWFGAAGGFAGPEVSVPDIPGIDEGPIAPPDVEVDDDVSGWDALTDFDGFLIAAAGVAGIALAGLAAAGRKVNLGGLPRGCVTAALGALAVALIVWRLFAQPTPGADLEIGIFLGLAAAIGVTLGAVMALREGGFEPLPAAGGAARPRTSSSAKRRSPKSSSSAAKPRKSGSSATRKRPSGGRK